MTEQEVIERLREAIKRAGSQRALAQAHGISEQYLTDVLRGRRAITARIAAVAGVERIVVVEYREGAKDSSEDSAGAATRGDISRPDAK